MEKYTVMSVDMKSQTVHTMYLMSFFILTLYNQALLKRNPLYCCHIGLSAAVGLVSACEIFF